MGGVRVSFKGVCLIRVGKGWLTCVEVRVCHSVLLKGIVRS